MLEEFMKLKPTRAIDRLLTEHSIDKVYLLYNTLQYIFFQKDKK